ncbi:hypothetical protein BLA60_10810 [Actinophytocola xinjiangensis]|uniref:DUF397 domain-containing protein n=1 Tax=Actinophytocola xinjiangensis TaxID=485602 RepID=A0A7Z0WRK3_9PSEU|nr:DUF397 domain-containing protein [Actinophytocola xinjiangensis]OLF11458.1 hypothetical protein BLA60_10810 [Actinophytocola xinjiangensis]
MTWRSSSYSDDINCVQVRGDLAALRDSKDVSGPLLTVPALRELVRGVKAGRWSR